MREAREREDPADRDRPHPDLGAEQPLALASLERRKRRDAAVALPLAALLLFASPLLDLVAGAGFLLGVPVAGLYIFGAWFALIALTARLARRLVGDGER